MGFRKISWKGVMKAHKQAAPQNITALMNSEHKKPPTQLGLDTALPAPTGEALEARLRGGTITVLFFF